MRTNFVSQKKDNEEKDFYQTLSKNLNAGGSLMKFAASSGVERPNEIVKEGMVINYNRKDGEYTIKLGHRADIVVTGVARQEADLQKQVRSALAYIGHMSPKLAEEMKKVEAERRDLLVYKDIDRCRDCVWYESDTSHETYRDKCKFCKFATLGGDLNNFFPRSQQMVVFTPGYEQVGDAPLKEKDAFQGSLSLLDAHRVGQVNEVNAECAAKEIISKVGTCSCHGHSSAVCLGTELMKYCKLKNVNFPKHGGSIIAAVEKQSGIEIHLAQGKNTVIAVDKTEMMKQSDPKQVIAKMKVTAKEMTPEEARNYVSFEEIPDVGMQAFYAQFEGEIPEDTKEFFVEDMKENLPYVLQNYAEQGKIFPGSVLEKNLKDISQRIGFDLDSYLDEVSGKISPEDEKEFMDLKHEEDQKTIDDIIKRTPQDKMNYPRKAAKKATLAPGAFTPSQRKALEEYENMEEVMPKSKEIMPKGSFAGTLCLAEVK